MKKNSVNTQTEALRLADEAAAELQEQQVLVAERLMDCDHCGGTGVDGDVDDRGRTIDVQCRSCAGSGKSRYFGKCADGKRCLQGCLGTEGCYWENRAAKEQPAQQPDDERIAALRTLDYCHGLKAGWNFCAADDDPGFERAIAGTSEVVRILKTQPAQQQEQELVAWA
jgi:hypothetical protein